MDEGIHDEEPKPWQRFYMGYRERFVDDCILELEGGHTRVHLSQAPSAKVAAKHKLQKGKKSPINADKDSDPALTGTTVWDGAVVLSHYLTETNVLQDHMASVVAAEARAAEQAQLAATPLEEGSAAERSAGDLAAADPSPALQIEGPVSNAASAHHSHTPTHLRCRLPNCLELGAGTGAVSLALLACKKVRSATITDIPDLLPHIRHNVERNASLFSKENAIIQPLSWGPPGDDIPKLQAEVQHSQRQGHVVVPRSGLQAPQGAAFRQPGGQPAAQISEPHMLQSPEPSIQGTRGDPIFDVITGSDLIYYSYTEKTPHTRLLIWTLKQLMRRHTLIVLSLSLHHNPEEVKSFLQWASQEGLEVRRVPKEEIPEEMRVPDVILVQMRLTHDTQ